MNNLTKSITLKGVHWGHAQIYFHFFACLQVSLWPCLEIFCDSLILLDPVEIGLETLEVLEDVEPLVQGGALEPSEGSVVGIDQALEEHEDGDIGQSKLK